MNECSYIKGNVVRLLFDSSTGYKVGLFKVREASGSDVLEYINKTLTFTGNFMSLNNELTYIFYGKIVNHARFGVQFNVTSYESVTPSDSDGIVMYLSSGIFKGIGSKLAKAIVDTFGEDTIEEIKNGNPRLTKVRGMSLNKARELREKLIEYDKDQAIIMEFNKMGFTTQECLSIVSKYKDKCFDIIENNIYQLEEDINFVKLDSVFLSFNEEDAPVRINAIIKYSIKNLCYASGNTLVSRENLYVEINKFFSKTLDSGVFVSHINELIECGDIIEVGEYITLSNFYETEQGIAHAINYLSNIKSDFKEEKILKEITMYEENNDIVFNDCQKEAIKGSLLNNVFIITGGPGTGKTTILKAIVFIYDRLCGGVNSQDITLLAPTGRAAKRIMESVNRKASTIHKFLKWNKETKQFSVNKYYPADTKLVIIDEFSMVDIFLFNSLLEGLPTKVKLVMVGDANQLPSIAPGNILHDLLSVESIKNKYLDIIYRTSSESYIIPFAQDIKNRVMLESVPLGYNDFKFIESPDYLIKNYVTEVCLHAKEKGIQIEDFQVLVPMYKGENGIDNINKVMQGIFNPEMSGKAETVIRDVLYRVGDKVIQLQNDVENNISNGDVGYISKIIGDIVYVDFNGNTVEYNRGKYDEFTHAYAISVHKSQGSEYDNVLIVVPSNMKRMLYNKLIYTAVTRAKKGLIIIGSIDGINYAIGKDYSENRQTSLKSFF